MASIDLHSLVHCDYCYIVSGIRPLQMQKFMPEAIFRLNSNLARIRCDSLMNIHFDCRLHFG